MVRPGRSWRWRVPLLSALLLGLGALVLALGGFDNALLDLMPLTLLVATMLVWPYPGADLIAGLVKRRGRRPSSAAIVPRARPPLRTPHGGRLIALSLGGRAPPAPAGCA